MSTHHHTPGPWQVVTEEHPHYLGGTHTETRIFTAWDHPQAKGPLGVVNSAVGIGAEKDGPARHLIVIEDADAHLIAAAPDLLQALRSAEAALDYAASKLKEQCGYIDTQIMQASEDASEAIARATGTTNQDEE